MNSEFIEALTQIEKDKGVSKDILIEAIEAALISAFKRNYGTSENVRVDINRENGEIKVFALKNIVEEVTDPSIEMTLEEAKKISKKYKMGEVVEFEVTPKTFGRIAAQTAKQVVMQRIREAERGIIYDQFASREGDIISGLVQRIDKKNVIIDMGKIEAILAPQEQIPGEVYRQNERIKSYVLEVRKTTKGPEVYVSRTHPGLVKRLFELEVPEIHEGVVQIRSIAREAGSRAKIAVCSLEENIDPVGACVGQRGTRVQNIVDELQGEKIDIIEWSDNPAEFIASSLNPSKVLKVEIFEQEKAARVVVPDYQLSLAIGKEGQNARLAAKLTGWKIDIKSETQVAENFED
ncbi:MAG: transcription termination factor NusA [Deltaproteobacteria bacterium]